MVGRLSLPHRRRARWSRSPAGKAHRSGFRAAPGRSPCCSGSASSAINFNAVYLAERHITSGLVATVFALLLIPNAVLAWAWLGDRPNRRFIWSSIPAIAGIVLLFVHEMRADPSGAGDVLAGIGLTLAGLIRRQLRQCPPGDTGSQARPAADHARLGHGNRRRDRRHGRLVVAGPPTFDPRPGYVAGLLYLAFAASALAFSLYIPGRARDRPGARGLFERAGADHRDDVVDPVRRLSLVAARRAGRGAGDRRDGAGDRRPA